jgi:hypothetical protein
MEFLDLQREYPGKFVAIENEEKVIASGDTFNEVVKKLEEMKVSKRRELSIRYIRPNSKRLSGESWRF